VVNPREECESRVPTSILIYNRNKLSMCLQVRQLKTIDGGSDIKKGHGGDLRP